MRHAARLGVALVFITLTACSGGDTGDTLDGTSWRAVELRGRPTVADVVLTVELGGGEISGNGGCNSYTGTYEADPTTGAPKGGPPTIAIGQIGSTEMACEDLVMEQESAFLAALVRATTYRLVTDRLELLNPDGETLIALVRTSADDAGY